MHDNRNDYEPIIATRGSRERLREDARPLWHLVLALGLGLAVIVFLVWWWMDRSSSDSVSTTAQSQSSAPEVRPDTDVEQAPAPPALDSEGACTFAAPRRSVRGAACPRAELK